MSKPFVVCAVHELSRHMTKVAAEIEMEQYEPTREITYVIVNTGDRDAGAGTSREPEPKQAKKAARVHGARERGHGAHGRGAGSGKPSGRGSSGKRS